MAGMTVGQPVREMTATSSALTALSRILLLAAVTGVCAWWSVEFTRGPAGLSTLWLASGVLCGVLLTSPRARWPAYIASALSTFVLVNRARGSAWDIALLLSVANTVDAIGVAFVIARGVDSVTDMSRLTRISLLAVGGTGIACGISALLAAATLMSVTNAAFGDLYRTWFASHALGMVIAGTLTVVARAEGRRLLGARGRRVELLLTLLLTVVVCLLVFDPVGYPLPFLVFPPLLLAAFRHRFSGFVLGSAVVAVIAATEHALGHGPFAALPGYSEAARTLMLQAFIASACLLALPVAIVLTHLRLLNRRVTASEHDYRMLAEYSRDMVVRMDASGRRRYISPAASEILGWDIEDLRSARWDLVHPDDREPLAEVVRNLYRNGGSATAIYRARHRDGQYVWIEAHARLVPSPDPGEAPDLIYAGRDITRRITAEHELERNQRRLRAITDHMPAFVVHVDASERYTFINAHMGKAMAMDPASMVGRSVREVLGEAMYARLKPYLAAVMSGETVTFEIEREFDGELRHHQSTYVPDFAADGSIVGFYGVTFDISRLKLAEKELDRLLRHDPLTGLANRFHFNERLELAIARSHRTYRSIALLYLDIDHFKGINDTLGHAAGDAVLREFARRLHDSVREVDLVARLGGDEFVVLLDDIDAPGVAQMIARKLMTKLGDPIRVEGHERIVTASIGIAFHRHPVPGADALMQLADAALYEAKAAGRNTFRMAG
jgi:diguanylate cyclase (GGDEF)-like protein/PAS domain S-box-containing protein